MNLALLKATLLDWRHRLAHFFRLNQTEAIREKRKGQTWVMLRCNHCGRIVDEWLS